MAVLLDSSLDAHRIERSCVSTPESDLLTRDYQPVAPMRIDGWPTGPMPASGPRAVWRIERGMRIRGELDGAMDVAIDGTFDGRINLEGHYLSTGAASRVDAEIIADTVLVRGELTGSIRASSKILLARTARVRGSLHAPDIELVAGCTFDGRIERPGLDEH